MNLLGAKLISFAFYSLLHFIHIRTWFIFNFRGFVNLKSNICNVIFLYFSIYYGEHVAPKLFM